MVMMMMIRMQDLQLMLGTVVIIDVVPLPSELLCVVVSRLYCAILCDFAFLASDSMLTLPTIDSRHDYFPPTRSFLPP